MSTVKFYDSTESARLALDSEKPELAFSDAIKGVDLSDAQQTISFLAPQLMRVEQSIYMVKYPDANYAEFVPVDTTGTVWTAGSIFYSGDVAGKAEWFDVAADDMPYADFARTQFLQARSAAWHRHSDAEVRRGNQGCRTLPAQGRDDRRWCEVCYRLYQ